MKKRVPVILAVLSTAAILFFTLRHGDNDLTHGWSYSLTSGDAALAELIQNLILFIPLGVSLTLARVLPGRVVAIGGLLSFTVEFLQQYIPGRDPSVGDIVCNTISTALGVLLVVAAPIWLWVSPRRSVWQARLTALVAVLVWYGTGAMLRQAFSPGPYQIVTTPSFNNFGYYNGQVLKITPGIGSLEVLAVAAPYPPGRRSPLIAALGRRVDMWTLWRRRTTTPGTGLWHRVATFVMRRPAVIALSVVALLHTRRRSAPERFADQDGGRTQ